MEMFKIGELVTVLEKPANYIDKENLELGWASPNMDEAIGKDQLIQDIIKRSDVTYYKLEDNFKYPENILCLTASHFFDIGDYVKIVRLAKSSETTGWVWVEAMTKTIGTLSKVVGTSGNYSRLECNSCWYHNNVLKLVQKKEENMIYFKEGDLVEVIDPKHRNFDESTLDPSYGWIKEMNISIGKILEIEKIKNIDSKVYCKLSDGWFYPQDLLVISSHHQFYKGEKVVVFRKHYSKENNKYPWHKDMTIDCNLPEYTISNTESNHSFLKETGCWYHNNVLDLVDNSFDDFFDNPFNDFPDNTDDIITSPCKS